MHFRGSSNDLRSLRERDRRVQKTSMPPRLGESTGIETRTIKLYIVRAIRSTRTLGQRASLFTLSSHVAIYWYRTSLLDSATVKLEKRLFDARNTVGLKLVYMGETRHVERSAFDVSSATRTNKLELRS